MDVTKDTPLVRHSVPIGPVLVLIRVGFRTIVQMLVYEYAGMAGSCFPFPGRCFPITQCGEGSSPRPRLVPATQKSETTTLRVLSGCESDFVASLIHVLIKGVDRQIRSVKKRYKHAIQH